jgi:hypothetical protein
MIIGLYNEDGSVLLGTAEVPNDKFKFPGNAVSWKGRYYAQQFEYGAPSGPVPFLLQPLTLALPDDAVIS